MGEQKGSHAYAWACMDLQGFCNSTFLKVRMCQLNVSNVWVFLFTGSRIIIAGRFNFINSIIIKLKCVCDKTRASVAQAG